MVQNLLTQLSELLNNSDDIKLDEIPEYRLFISQLEEFFEKKLGKSGGSNEEERKTISRTMIQNYIKDGLLMPPEGKSYNRSHIILLALIYSLKPILSIRDIRRLLTPVISDMNYEDDGKEIDNIYENYLSLKQNSLQSLNDELKTLIDRIGDQTITGDKTGKDLHQLRLLLFITTLITEANYRKKIAEFLIEEYFDLEI